MTKYHIAGSFCSRDTLLVVLRAGGGGGGVRECQSPECHHDWVLVRASFWLAAGVLLTTGGGK